MSTYPQSDDDLFSYDPSNEPVKSSKNISSNSSSSSNSDIYNQISKSIENNDDDAIVGNSALRVKFSQAVLGSYDFWVSPTTAVAYTQTVSQILEELTGGRFGDLYLYNYLEMTIFRRNNIICLLNETFKEEENSDSESFRKFLKKLKIDITPSYIPTYIGTLIRISSHLLSQERAMYLALAQKLNVIPNSLILEEKLTHDNIISHSKISVSNTQDQIINSKFMSNINESFIEKLNNLNNQSSDYVVRYI